MLILFLDRSKSKHWPKKVQYFSFYRKRWRNSSVEITSDFIYDDYYHLNTWIIMIFMHEYVEYSNKSHWTKRKTICDYLLCAVIHWRLCNWSLVFFCFIVFFSFVSLLFLWCFTSSFKITLRKNKNREEQWDTISLFISIVYLEFFFFLFPFFCYFLSLCLSAKTVIIIMCFTLTKRERERKENEIKKELYTIVLSFI